ncbi:MAG: carboxypeptidase-like regulatory domain-containing protein [Actinomycetia bacterium]|nr:carboxypeptidase-like regulatory domain-containing protein [Actinomycetes bacterium]
MRIISTIALILLIQIKVSGQVIAGKVTDSKTNEPLEYVSIGIINTNFGTITDSNGYFMFEAKVEELSIVRISMIGYKAQTFSIKELFGKENVIKLIPSVIQLEEVTVKSGTETKIIGVTKRTVKGGVCGWGGDRRGKGYELGSKFYLGASFVRLQSLHIRVHTLSYDSILLRLHIRNIKDGLPHEELINENIYFTIEKSSGWVEIDLKEYDIVLKDEIALTIEWIKVSGLNKKNLVRVNKSKQKTANVLFSVKRNSGCIYVKKGVEGKWWKGDTQSPSMYLTIRE